MKKHGNRDTQIKERSTIISRRSQKSLRLSISCIDTIRMCVHIMCGIGNYKFFLDT